MIPMEEQELLQRLKSSCHVTQHQEACLLCAHSPAWVHVSERRCRAARGSSVIPSSLLGLQSLPILVSPPSHLSFISFWGLGCSQGLWIPGRHSSTELLSQSSRPGTFL
ncbi:hypothetical protein ACRRTK_013671 [Alexandromys fortis]